MTIGTFDTEGIEGSHLRAIMQAGGGGRVPNIINPDKFDDSQAPSINRRKPKVTKVSLNAYETVKATILKDHKGVKIYIELIKATDSLAEQFKKKFASLKDEVAVEQVPTISDLSPWIGVTADVISSNQPGFTQVMLNPIMHGYSHMVYKMTFKLAPYLELPYIGYAQNFKERLKTHISKSLEQKSRNLVSTHIDKAHLIAIERELEVIAREIIRLDISVSLRDIQDLKDLQNWIYNNPKDKTYLLEFIVDEVIKKHFTVKAIEFHKSLDSVRVGEKAKTLALRHTIGGRTVTGTIFPNGLNMREGGGGGGLTKTYPILDILLLASLGFKNIKIAEILTKVYKSKFTDSTISRKIGKVEEIQALALRPLFFELFSYRDATTKSGFSMKRIAEILRHNAQYFSQKVSDWFYGLDHFELKYLIDTGLDLGEMSEHLGSVKRSVRYHTQQTWIDWLITSPTHFGLSGIKYVASHARVSENSLNSKIFIHQLATYILGENRIYVFSTLKAQLRVDRTVELLRWGKDPRDIMENTFQIQFESNIQLKLFYETLFRAIDQNHEPLSFDDIIYSYSSLPGYYLGKYK
ncbi:hypothetical protein LCGC14_1705950 [marine sediment metagenome]|uniref:Uncharacterized protein n=1 Tax=marine sediment metagenome TaxID=412755 RepID=A0A0F9JX11_9ZZZZ